MLEENFLLERFECINKTGAGAMGSVYKAVDKNFNNMVVALKVLNDEFFTDANRGSPDSSNRLTAAISHDATIPLTKKTSPVDKQIDLKTATTMLAKEAAAAARINHPNVVRIYNTDEIAGKQYISMEFIDGEDFAEILSKKGKLSLDETLKYGIQVCRGLRAAHINNIVHRDIKPSNLMLTKDNVVKITDLGIAKLFEEINIGPQLNTVGTLSYMSPQQLLGQKADARCDIYSFGIVLYEFLTGHPPFRTGDIIHQHLNILPKSPSRFVKDIPKEVENLVLKCLQKNPDDRYQNIDELLKDFVRCIKPSKVKDTSENSTSSKQSKRKLHTAIGVGTFILVIIIASVLFKKVWNKSPEQSMNDTLAIASMENLQYNNWTGFNKRVKNAAFVQKITKIHPDFLGIAYSQIFINYINNLPSQKHKTARQIADSGSAEEVSRLLTDFKEQMRIINTKFPVSLGETSTTHIKQIQEFIINPTWPSQNQKGDTNFTN